MKHFYCFTIKRHFRPLLMVIVLLLGRLVVNAQCYTYSLNAYQVSPSYIITSPTWVTLRAEMYNEFAGQDNMSWGRIYWYYQETGGEPFSMTEIGTNQWSYGSTVEFNATWNTTVWYCYYDYWTNCETVRIPYEFPYLTSTPPTPPVYINWEYGYVCGNAARFKVNSNATPVLYKQSSLGGNNYEEITSSGSGYFEIPDYNPNTQYYVGASNGITSAMYGVSLDYYSNQPLPIIGNKTIMSGNSTTLTENSGYNFYNIRWFDGAGNLVHDGSQFTTPILTANATYQVRGYNDQPDGGTCVTEPSYVTIQVNQPPPPVTCDHTINIYQSNPYPAYALCSPQTVTLTAEMYNPTVDHDRMAWGAMNFYYQETGGTPFSSQEVYTNWYTFNKSVDVYANTGVTVWVSYKDYWTGCESPRIPYEFYVSPTPYLYVDYAYACGNVAKVKVNSNAAVVVYKQSSMGGNNYEQVMYAGASTFEISNYEPGTSYFLMAGSTCNSQFYPLSFDVFPTAAPPVTGNTILPVGGATTLTADNGSYYGYKWYDASGNFLFEGQQYTTPALTENVYTYQVRSFIDGDICLSDPATVTVTVDLPVITYSPLYRSSNFTKTIDETKPVGIINGMAGTTPTGGSSYSIPIFTSPGTNGFAPSISINYNSQSGNGILGQGWNIAGLSVIGRTGMNLYHNTIIKPVSYTSSDAFTLNGTRLNPVSGSNGANGTIYASETENFAKIVSYGANANNPDWFQVTSKDGTVMEFGNSTESRVLTDDGANVVLWRLNRIIDVNGNYITFKYDNGYRDHRISEIYYTGNSNTGLLPYNSILFNYKIREDRNVYYEKGASLASKYLLTSINVKSEGNTVKTYQFNYGYDYVTSFLTEITESGSDGTSLNSTNFIYGDKPQNITWNETTALKGTYDFFAGDFDADGRSDLLAAESYLVPNTNTRLHKNYRLYKDINSSSATYMFKKDLPQGANGSEVIQDRKFYNFLTADYDGDGRDDVLQINGFPEYQGGCNDDYKRKITGGVLNYTKSFNSGTGMTDVIESSFSNPVGLFGDSYQYVHGKGNFFIPGDFDGDGNKDFIFILARRKGEVCLADPMYTYEYKAFLSTPSTNEFNQEVLNFGVGNNTYGDFYAETIADADFINTIDFDGDGRTELLVTKNYYSYVISINKLAPSTGLGYSASIIYTTYEINKNDKIYTGDFNNDNKTDLLVRSASGSWNIMNGTGTGYKSQPFTFNQTPQVTGSGTLHKVIVSDFDGDGKSDILHAYQVFNPTGAKFSVYYSRGMNSSTPFYYEQYDYDKLLGEGSRFVIGDFNGDGRSDILNVYYYDNPADFISFKPHGKERLLAKVVDGHNSVTEFQYKSLAEPNISWPFFYYRPTSLDDAANMNPFNYVQFPMFVVSAMITPAGVGNATSVTSYNYEDAVVHRAEKGFLGFKKIVSKNSTSGLTTTTEYDINTDFAVPYIKSQTSMVTGNSVLVSEQKNDVSFVSVRNGAKSFVMHFDKTLQIDHLSNSATETVNTYDNYGNITNSVVKTGALSGISVNATETVITTTNYGVYNTPVPARPVTTTVVSERTGSPAVTRVTEFTYTAEGLQATNKEFANLSNAVTTTVTYNRMGNPITSTLSSNGLNPRITTMVYDSKGRLAETKQQTGSGITQTESATYDFRWGKPLTQTTSDCLTSSYEYDGYGRIKKTTLPAGFSINASLVWDRHGDNVYYTFTDYPGGSPDEKNWFDKLGRETQKQMAGFNNQWLTQQTKYDVRGNVETKTNLHYSTETPVTTTHTYDDFNRLSSATNAIGTVDYVYTKLGGDKVEVTITSAGQTTSKVTDATNKIIRATDKGGQLDYTYDSWGNQKQVKHGGVIVLDNTYDNYGRQTTATDRNTGTMTYVYDAFGQLKVQTDNNGNTYNMVYDDFGRISSRQGPEGLTTYEYYRDLVTGCSNDKIFRVINHVNGIVKEFTFDNLKRIQTETVTIDGIPHITQYDYNTYGAVTKITYPSGVVVNNVFDNNGNLLTVTGGNNASPKTLFTGTAMNGYGEYTGYTLGNNLSGQNTYTYGYPTRYYTPGIQDLNFNFDYAKGNLLSRQDAIKNITETFGYDDLNRLISTTVNNVPQLTLGFDGNSSHSMGNIVSKTDAGDYVYHSSKVNAVAYITNPAGATLPPANISTNEQQIIYTPFLKAGTISEGNYQLEYVYGADYQRAKSILKQNNSIIETKYYFGDYEKQISNGVTREIHYVKGGNGVCAIIERENGVNNYYFVYADYLGSLLTFTDLNGTKVAEQNFDAWGRNRNADSWQYGNVAPVPVWLYRGYTSHEHLPQFGLINMNGRLYDPVQGRMLSADNYVADPLGTQNYNRYSYAMNNPLAYVDADGNNPVVLAVIIGAAMGAYAGGMMANSGELNPFKWDYDSDRTIGWMIGGALMGAAGGYVGATVGASGMPMANVAGAISGSLVTSSGMNILTNGAMPVSMSFGFGSIQLQSYEFSLGYGPVDYNFNYGRFEYLGKKGNTPAQNLSFALRTAQVIFEHRKSLFLTDEKKTFMGKTWQIASRFTWELPQTLVGMMFFDFFSTFSTGTVTHKGMTFVKSKLMGIRGGMTIGNHGTLDRYGIEIKHEWGHTVQSRILGPLYLPLVAIPSLFRAGLDVLNFPGNYMNFYTEKGANNLSKKHY